MEDLSGNEMEKVSYAVFGCGHHDWVDTFLRIPKLVDTTLEKRGGARLVPMGSADAATSDMFSDFEAWEDTVLWPALKEKYNVTDDETNEQRGLLVEVTTPRKTTLRQDVEEALVVSEKTLTKSGPPKKHIEIQLPSGMTYKAGDYLAILPLNPRKTVSRVFRRFSLAWDSFLKIQSDGPTTLPTNIAISAFDVFSAYVELSQPATKRVCTLITGFSSSANISRTSLLWLKQLRTSRPSRNLRDLPVMLTKKTSRPRKCQSWTSSRSIQLLFFPSAHISLCFPQ
jgi:cytochrome P450/NADPH-cytochrome P450 reductase